MKRKSGVLMHVSALWGDYSEGAFGEEALRFIDFLADSGFTAWQVLPFCLPDECYSPYKSFGAFSGNPNFIDLKQLRSEGLLTDAELKNAEQKTPYYCEFPRLEKERLALLSLASSRLTDTREIDSFMSSHPETEEFCEFMALKSANGGRPWQEWDCDVPDPAALKAWRFIQYEFFFQWRKIREYASEKGVSVIGDMPIYVSLDSSDVRSEPGQFKLGADFRPTEVAGVPPDYFAEDGQLWGNPLYDWEKMKEDGFSWWRRRLAFACELFDGVRIDHFRAIESYYSIPAAEKTAKNGSWIPGPGMDFVNMAKEVCGDRLIIAEDLGDITPEVRKLVGDSGFPGMRVLQFGFLGDGNSPHLPHNYDNNCVAYTGTHDNNTLLGYVWELDDETRKKLLDYFGYGSENWDDCYDTVMRSMLASHAGLVILPVQDLLRFGSDTRFNKPGTGEDNWNFRITKAQLDGIDRKKFLGWNRLYGRV